MCTDVKTVHIESSEQIPALIKNAMEEKLPLIPVSSRGKHRRGDTDPCVDGTVIVDMSGLNKILHISRQQRIAVVQPGVTYPQLQKALAEEGMMLSSPLAPRGTKSVIGSVLEIEPRLNCIHQWEYYEPLRCTEVTWGDGNTIFTGEAGRGPKDLPSQWDSQKWQITGAGPNMIDFVRLLTGAQGSMGIVSWASLKCEVKPTIHHSYFIASDDVNKLTDFMYKVIRPRFSDELFVVNKKAFAALAGGINDAKAEWVAFCGIAGREILPEMRVRQQTEDICDIAKECGLEMSESFGGVSAEDFYAMINGTEDREDWRDGFEEIPFITTMDKAGEFVKTMDELLASRKAGTQQYMAYIQPQHCGTSAHMEFLIPQEMDDEILAKAQDVLAEHGAYYSRPYGRLADIQLPKDKVTYRMQQELKEIFDPAGIMNPGKLKLK